MVLIKINLLILQQNEASFYLNFMVKSSMFLCIHLINVMGLPCAEFPLSLRTALWPFQTELVVLFSPFHLYFMPNSARELITVGFF